MVTKRRTNYSIDRIHEMSLVQEITYITFKKDIVKYLEDLKKREEEEFQRCKVSVFSIFTSLSKILQ